MEKGFIFDMDGVIINSEPIHHMVDLEVAKVHGIPMDLSRIQSYVGMRTRDVWELVIKEEKLPLKADDLHIYGAKLKVKYIEQSELQPIDGILELLNQLRALEYKIGLASSSPKVLIDVVLRKFRIDSYFDCRASGEEVKNGKPAPDIYLEVARRLNINTKKCLVLEDSPAGIESANKAGMKTIGFLNPDSGNQDLSKAKYLINSINEISCIL